MSGLKYEEVMRWSIKDVLNWLKEAKLSEFSDFVISERIGGSDLIQLDKARISGCKNIPKGKREALLKRLKELEKDKLKMQKCTKGESKTVNEKPVPVANSILPLIFQGAAYQLEDEGDEDFVDDEEWDDDQGIYDNDENLQPPKSRIQKASLPSLPPPEMDSDEDYIVPNESVSPPHFHPTQRPDEDDDNWYEKANQATILTQNIPPLQNSPMTTQRAVPPPPVQGPNIPPPRGGRAPIAPTHQPNLNEENDLAPSVPPPRGGRAPVAPAREPLLHEETDQDSSPRNSSPPPLPLPFSGPKQSRAQRPEPHEIYEETEQEDQKPPSLPRGRDGRPVPPIPPTEIYEDPGEQDPVVPEYESMEELKAKMNQATATAHDRGPVPVPQRENDEKIVQKVPPTRTARRSPPTPAHDDIYEAADEEEEVPSTRPQPPPPKPADEELCRPTDAQKVTPARSARAPPPIPVDDEFYESADDRVRAPLTRTAHASPPDPADVDSFEATDEQKKVTPARSARAPPPIPVDEEFYEPADDQQPSSPSSPPPPPPASNLNLGRQRAAAPMPRQNQNEEQSYEEKDEKPQINRKHEEVRPQKPEKLPIDKKLPAGLPSTGFPLNTLVIRDAKTKLRPALRKDIADEQSAAGNPSPQEVKGFVVIKDILQAKSQSKATITAPKKIPTAPSVAKIPVAHPSHPTTVSNAPGAPEPTRRRHERDPPPGPPGAPPETAKSPAAVPSSVADPNDITVQSWYFGNCGREKATELLKTSKEEGTYLVRDSKGSGQPYTLCIFYRGDIFNIAIRKRPDGKFALGTEKQVENVFETICDMIRFHRNNAIDVSKTGNLVGRVKLVKVAGN